MATTYFFRAVASDGKPRTGTLSADNDSQVVRELKRQGLIPVYVGLEQKKELDRKSTRLNSSHIPLSRMPSSA